MTAPETNVSLRLAISHVAAQLRAHLRHNVLQDKFLSQVTTVSDVAA